jgi:hypothetical protein
LQGFNPSIKLLRRQLLFKTTKAGWPKIFHSLP